MVQWVRHLSREGEYSSATGQENRALSARGARPTPGKPGSRRGAAVEPRSGRHRGTHPKKHAGPRPQHEAAGAQTSLWLPGVG